MRLDGGTTHTGAEVSAHFDSMLVKLTCYGHDFPNAVRRARRAIAEFRIRGVSTEPAVPGRGARRPGLPGRAGVTTSFIDERPAAAAPPASRPTAAPGCSPTWPSHGQPAQRRRARTVVEPVDKLPAVRPEPRRPRTAPGSCCAELGPGGLRGPAARAAGGRGHRHHVPRRAPVAAGHPGAHPGPARRGPVRGPDGAAAAVAWSAGAARPTTWRCGSSPRTRGSGWPRCARRCPTSAPRCCCAGATPSATRRTRPR